jgi:hypothetical protein
VCDLTTELAEHYLDGGGNIIAGVSMIELAARLDRKDGACLSRVIAALPRAPESASAIESARGVPADWPPVDRMRPHRALNDRAGAPATMKPACMTSIRGRLTRRTPPVGVNRGDGSGEAGRSPARLREEVAWSSRSSWRSSCCR